MISDAIGEDKAICFCLVAWIKSQGSGIFANNTGFPMILLLHLKVAGGIIRAAWGNQFFEPIFDIPVAAQETAGFSTGKTGARERLGGQPN